MYPYMKPQRKDVVYTQLRQDILSGKIPARAGLAEESLAKKLGVSRTPIREAILMLEADGLVKMYPNKGPIVTGIGLEDIIWITQIREGLEGIAAKIACKRADKEELKKIKEKLLAVEDLEIPGNVEKSFLYGREIHDLMMKSTGNKRMIKIVDNLTDQLDHIMQLSTEAPGRAEKTYEQHINLLDALINENQEKAELYVRDHITSVTNDAIKVYQQKSL